jgi:hypothetical protein
MKALPFILVPSIALLVSACSSGPGGPGYGGPGYGGHDTFYVQGSDHRDYNNDQTTRNVTNVNDVNVNRTNVNDTTVNRTNVNQTNVKKTNVNKTNVNKTAARKPVEKTEDNHKGNQQPTPNP